MDGEDRLKAIGLVEGRLYTAVHVWRGAVIRLYRCAGAMPVKNDFIIALPADPRDADDFDVSVAGVEYGLLGRSLRRLRAGLGLFAEDLAARYGIPAAEYGAYETVRAVPPPAVLAYLHVIVAEPEAAARALERAA